MRDVESFNRVEVDSKEEYKNNVSRWREENGFC